MELNKAIIIENQYFPVINWFKYSFKNNYIVIFECESYQKMSFRNRTVILGSNGRINLTVPILKGRNIHLPFKEVKIALHEKWEVNHWRSIVSCYSKSPYFDYYRQSLEKLFTNQYEFIFDLNLEILYWLKEVLKFPAEIIVAGSEMETFYKSGVTNLTNRWLPKNFQLDEFPIKYPQVFEERINFQPNLGILDLLFNTGPEAGRFLSAQL